MNVDLETFSPEKLNLFIEELDKKLDEQLAREKARNIELRNELNAEYNKLNQLTQELYEQSSTILLMTFLILYNGSEMNSWVLQELNYNKMSRYNKKLYLFLLE